MRIRTLHSKQLFSDNQLPFDYCPPIIVGYNIKTPENVGSIIRLADNIACEKVLFITNDNTMRETKIKKTASSSFNSIDWKFCKLSDLENEIPPDYYKIAIETSSDSLSIYKTELPKKIVFIIGNEIAGIANELLDKCDKIIHIPVFGKNTSLNVSHALAISVFEWQKHVLSL